MFRQLLPYGYAALLLALPVTSQAANPHWANCPVQFEGDTLTVEGRISGLGNRQTTPLEVSIAGTALCIDLEALSIVASQPVTDTISLAPRRGTVNFAVDLTPVFDPACEPPLEVAFAAVTVCETTNPAIGCCPSEDVEE
jgi:hypothetical protein